MANFGFVRVAAAVPKVEVGDPDANAVEICRLIRDAFDHDVQVLVFPELAITGYACGQLFQDDLLIRRAQNALAKIVEDTSAQPILSLIGLPLRVDGQLFNVAVAVNKGKIVAIVPKSYIPTYKEFNEGKWFRRAGSLKSREVQLCDQTVPIGTDILIDIAGTPGAKLGIEICEDGWMPLPPSTLQMLAGANILVNLSASNGLLTKSEFRRDLFVGQSARAVSVQIYCSCGPWESSSDLVFDGDAFISENGKLIAESKRYSFDPQLIVTDVDIERLMRERCLTETIGENIDAHATAFRAVTATVAELNVDNEFLRTVDPHPMVPSDPKTLDERCEEVFAIQECGGMRRLMHVERCTKHRRSVIGVSGGRDSTLALLVLVRIYDRLGWDRKDIIAITMSSFGTTDRSYDNTVKLCRALGVTFREITIRNQTLVHLRELGHLREDETIVHRKCPTCQNAQARIRTLILMNTGFVIGTGDLEELALGWCTYNGDHMSMYNLNCTVSKLLASCIIRWVADRNLFGDEVAVVLRDILADLISPMLDPVDEHGHAGDITEDLIGPYELHSFFLSCLVRYGYEPRKIIFLARHAKFDEHYTPETLLKWLGEFYRRFFANQFKRDAVPNGPKVGSISLGPRGDWKMPSDITGALWISEVECMLPPRLRKLET